MQIGPYELTDERPLGSGAMSVVYRAVQEELDRVVALKVLAPHLESDPEAVKRFRDEARAAAKLKHPHIVTIYLAKTDTPPYYIAMEYLDGGSLADQLAPGPLTIEKTIQNTTLVASALDHAHKRKVIHRDVKPANIMFDAEGKLALTDFGIARVADAPGLTVVGGRLGTVNYMSPEQANGKEVDSRSDLYSLGVVVYEMLTGRVPFSNPEPLVTMKEITEHPIPSPRLHNPAIPAAVEAVLLKCLAKDPNSRYQTGAAFSRALMSAYRKAEGIRPRRMPKWAVIALLFATLGAIGVIGAAPFVRHMPTPPSPPPPPASVKEVEVCEASGQLPNPDRQCRPAPRSLDPSAVPKEMCEQCEPSRLPTTVCAAHPDRKPGKWCHPKEGMLVPAGKELQLCTECQPESVSPPTRTLLVCSKHPDHLKGRSCAGGRQREFPAGARLAQCRQCAPTRVTVTVCSDYPQFTASSACQGVKKSFTQGEPKIPRKKCPVCGAGTR